MKNSALVVIDLQNDITKNYREIIEKVNKAIDWAVEKGMWVIYIQHNNLSAGTRTFKPGTHGAELVPEMKVVSEHIFTKSKSNALTSDAFTAFIQERGITGFYIAGADATACIKSTCFNMAKIGYTVHVLSDCITSYDKKKLPERTVLFLCHSVVLYLPGPVLPRQVGRRHCAVERVLWAMQRNGATQAQGVEGRRPCANAQRPCAQSRDRFLTFCLLCLYGWLATGQQLSARCAGCSETEN